MQVYEGQLGQFQQRVQMRGFTPHDQEKEFLRLQEMLLKEEMKLDSVEGGEPHVRLIAAPFWHGHKVTN